MGCGASKSSVVSSPNVHQPTQSTQSLKSNSVTKSSNIIEDKNNKAYNSGNGGSNDKKTVIEAKVNQSNKDDLIIESAVVYSPPNSPQPSPKKQSKKAQKTTPQNAPEHKKENRVSIQNVNSNSVTKSNNSIQDKNNNAYNSVNGGSNDKEPVIEPTVNQSNKDIQIIENVKVYRPVSAKLKHKKHDFVDSQKFFDLTYEEAAKLQPESVDEMWAIVKKTSDKTAINVEPLKNRKGWRTIRIFVSSTFKDFHQEREVLVKEVFPDLRLWCEQRKLRLIECDLRWGVPKDSTTEETIKICLSELDRCYEDNVAPFFLNLAGQRTGWIPDFGDIASNLAAQYGWIYGLSVTEMEIVHGAFRKLNPNALFLLRNDDALVEIPDDLKCDFVDCEEKQIEKLKALKKIISTTFPPTNVFSYKVKGSHKRGFVEFEGLGGESEYSHTVFNFFQKRIEELYPLDPSPEDPLQIQKEAHETFLDSRSQCVLGREKLITQITDYVLSDNLSRSPLIVVGSAGAGKSALMAKCASDTVNTANNNNIRVPSGFKSWRVFFHFVGATPGSTDLAFFLQRLVKEIKSDMKDIVSDLETLIQLSNSLLGNESTEPMIIFIDAVNQLDEDKQQLLSRWIPEKLSPNVRLVISMIEGTPSHQIMRSFKPSPNELICGPLDLDSRKEIVSNILKTYNKRLDDDQLNSLVKKDGSSNPLWLTLACEELRVFGKFETLKHKIDTLPDDLISLEMDVFTRFEEETDGILMKATLCLLEASRHGLLETELLALLGDKNNIECPEYKEDEEEMLIEKTEEIVVKSAEPIDIDKDDVEQLTDKFAKLVDNTYVVKQDDKNKTTVNSTRDKGKQVTFLPARDWAIMYRNLKPLLRPCGDLGEGRLDFYHRSLSKAVRKKYFQGSEGYVKHTYNYWHGVLAGFFERVDDMDRKAEELPYHLEQLLDNNRLIRCLLEWPVFNRLFSEDFSINLLRSWQKAGGYSVASAMYKESLLLLKDSGIPLTEYAAQMEQVAMFLIQAGEYTEAFSFLEKCASMETEELGKRDDKLAEIYQLMAKCKSEVYKSYTYVKKSQLKEHRYIVEICRKSQSHRMHLRGEEHEFKTGLLNILLSYHLRAIAKMTSKFSLYSDAFAAIDQAIAIFEKMNDIGHVAEAIMTRSLLHPKTHFREKRQQLEKAMELCLKAYGENHLLYVRLCVNFGILYEMNGLYEKAYDYFIRQDKACMTTFLDSRSRCVLGRDKLITQITDYVLSDNPSRSPLLVIGSAGAGKSALMAKCASDTVNAANNNNIRIPSGFKSWRVFFHFVGATPGSTDLAFFLQRLTKEIKPDLKDIANDLETLIQLSNSLLGNENTEPMVLFIDAVNQLDEDKQQFLSRWIPEKLSPNVRLIISMIEGTESHQTMRSFKPSPKEVICGPLDMNSRKEIVSNILKTYNKRLDNDQLNALVEKDGSSNPLWLTLACEELRVFGKFETLREKIDTLPDDLINLEMDVFTRFEQETGGILMKATLCLLEVARHGLLETELLALLGDKNNIECPEYKEGENVVLVKKTEEMTVKSGAPIDIVKDDVEKLTEKNSKLIDDAYVVKEDDKNKNTVIATRKKGKQVKFLPARDWAIIYRNLKQLLRPCGDLGEGRLDFYHRSLSKAVRKKYFQGDEGYVKHAYNYWHGVLAGFFEGVDDIDRKAEELPHHLEQLHDNNRLIRCLLEWPVFDILFSDDFSVDLLRSWQKAGGYSVASAMYKESLLLLKDSGIPLTEYATQMEHVAMFLIQAGEYREAFSLLENRASMETEELGERDDHLAEIYQLMAQCKSEIVRSQNFVSHSQLQEQKDVVEICRKSQSYRKHLRGEEHDFKTGLVNILLCYHLNIIADLTNDNSFRTDAHVVIDQAIAIFEKMNDIGHVSEASMTKSFVNPINKQNFPEKKQQLEKAMELCLKAYGENHMLYVRLCLNMGIVYEDNQQFEEAYDYFVRWDKACMSVLGPSHPTTQRAKDTLNEATYVRVRESREHVSAGTA